jgi:hypothetical protein
VNVVALDAHRPVLGGSTIAAAAGVDPYCSPIRLWLEKSGRLAREETMPMRLGKLLEPAIFAALVQDGYSCERTPDAELRDAALPWLVGHPDGFGVGAYDGTVFEAKATARPTDALPVAHEAQVQTYMHLARLPVAVVAQLGGLTFQTWTVEYHEHLALTLLGLAERFVGYLRDGEQPPPSGHPDDRAALADAWDATPGKRVRETREICDARRELAALLEAEKARHARIEHLRAVVTAYMGDADTLVSAHDETVATWKGFASRRIDTPRLRAERPDLYEAYSGEATTRRFVLT